MARYGKVISRGVELTEPLTPFDEAHELLVELARKGYAAELIAYRGPRPDHPRRVLVTDFGSMDVARIGGGGRVHLISHVGEFAICGAGGSRAALNAARHVRYADPAEPVTCHSCRHVVEAAKAAKAAKVA